MRFWSPSKLRSGIENWAEITPKPLHKAVGALRRTFEEAAWKVGEIMRQGCHPALHRGKADQARTINDALKKLGYRALPTVDQGYSESLVFVAYFDRSADLLAKEVARIFSELFEIASAQSALLSRDPVDWAALQMKLMVADESHPIALWTKDACDVQPDDPNDADELVYWRKWRAPKWIFMKPFANRPYNSNVAWERMDEGDSKRALEVVEDRFNQRLIMALENAVDGTHVRSAKQVPQTGTGATSVSEPQASAEPESKGGRVNRSTGEADEWRVLHERFQSFAEEERNAGAARRDCFLRAYCDYKEHPEVWAEKGKPEQGPFCLLKRPETGLWTLGGGVNENFQERVRSLMARAGVALGCPKETGPEDFWLHRLFQDLRENNSDQLFAATKEGGVILRVCVASATFCARLERKALETSAPAPQQPPSQSGRLSATVNSPNAARRMETYLESKGIGQTEFAIRVGTTDRTLRAFRKTGKVRRDIFESIAKEMGTTKEALLKQE